MTNNDLVVTYKHKMYKRLATILKVIVANSRFRDSEANSSTKY